MNFIAYKNAFVAEATRQKKSDEYINKCLTYAKNLADKRLPIIYDEKHFSMLVGMKQEFLFAIANDQRKFYRYFTIPKSNGKVRKIAEPLPMLKEVQHYILRNILLEVPCSVYAKAYKPGSSLKVNAKFHRNQPVLVKLDIKDYFPSLHETKVFQLFHESLGYSESLSMLLTKLCTLNKGLPQGAPTSPYLSNLLTVDMDNMIYRFCAENGNLRYTRYADDISISGDMRPSHVISKVSQIVAANHLKINKEKIVVVRQHDRQTVTGVVVNNKLQAPKAYRKAIRLEMYYCQKYGLDNHLQARSEKVDSIKYCQRMLGKINYCLQLNRKDVEMQGYRDFMLEQLRQAKNK